MARPRLFVALWPPPEVVDALAAVERRPWPELRWTTPEQWHLTLRFLGSGLERAEVAEALTAVVQPPCALILGPRVRPLGRQLLVVDADGADALAGAVLDATGRLIPGDSGGQRFRGHLTVARARGRADIRRRGGQSVEAGWTATEFCLVESELRPEGAAYTTLARFPLNGHGR